MLLYSTLYTPDRTAETASASVTAALFASYAHDADFGGPPRLTTRTPQFAPGSEALVRRSTLRMVYADGTVRWWRLTETSETVGDSDLTIVATWRPLWMDAAESVALDGSGVGGDLSLALTGRTPADALAAIVATANGAPAMANGSALLTVGTIAAEVPASVDMIVDASSTLAALEALAAAAGARYTLAVVPGGGPAQEAYAVSLDVPSDSLAPSAEIDLTGTSTTAERATRHESDVDALSVVVPVAPGEAKAGTLAGNRWSIASTAGNAVTLSRRTHDLPGAAPPVVVWEDGALVGHKVQLLNADGTDGLVRTVTATAAPATLTLDGTPGASVALRILSPSGGALVSLTSPALSALLGEVSRVVEFPDVAPRANLIEQAGRLGGWIGSTDGVSADMSVWKPDEGNGRVARPYGVAYLPESYSPGTGTYGYPFVPTKETDPAFFRHGTAGLRVASADVGEGVEIAMADYGGPLAVHASLRIVSGSVSMQVLHTSGGTSTRIGKKATASAGDAGDTVDLFTELAVAFSSDLLPEGAGPGDVLTVAILAEESGTEYVLDAVSAVGSTSPVPYRPAMGPEALHEHAARDLTRRVLAGFDDVDLDVVDLAAAGLAGPSGVVEKPLAVGDRVRLRLARRDGSVDVVDYSVLGASFEESAGLAAVAKSVRLGRTLPTLREAVSRVAGGAVASGASEGSGGGTGGVGADSGDDRYLNHYDAAGTPDPFGDIAAADLATARANLGVPPTSRSVSGAGTLGFTLPGGGDLSADLLLTVTPPQDLRASAVPTFAGARVSTGTDGGRIIPEAGRLGVYAEDGTNDGEIYVDRLTVREIDILAGGNVNTISGNETSVEDLWVTLNVPDAGSPPSSSNGGVRFTLANATEAVALEFDQGNLRSGMRPSVGGTFQPFARVNVAETVTAVWDFTNRLDARNIDVGEQVTLGLSASSGTEAVRADTTVTLASSLGFTGTSGDLIGDLTLTLTPPQDLRTTATPTFFGADLRVAGAQAADVQAAYPVGVSVISGESDAPFSWPEDATAGLNVKADNGYRNFQLLAGGVSDRLRFRTGLLAGGWNGWRDVWHSGYQGAGTGMDADLWDGYQFADYLNQGVRTTDNVQFADGHFTGNVGIGTTSPAQELDVSAANAPTIRVTSETLNNVGRVEFYDEVGGAVSGEVRASYNAGSSYLQLDSAGSVRTLVGGVEQMRATSSGVGIGTASPGDKLVVVGDVQIVKASNPRLFIRDSAAAADEKEYLFQSSGGVFSGYAMNDARSGLSQWLGVDRTGHAVGKVYFPTGNVGIGTSAPAYKLDVAGGGRFTGDVLIQKANAWLSLDSVGTGGDGTDQAAGISIGESGHKGGASLHLTYRGNGYGHIGMGAVTDGLPAYEAIRLYYLDDYVRMPGRVRVGSTAAPVTTFDLTGTMAVSGHAEFAGTVDTGGTVKSIAAWSLLAGSAETTGIKASRIGSLHYDAAEEPVTLLYGYHTASGNTVHIGGGTSVGNAATEIRFWTAASNTTTTGSQRAIIDSAGNLGVNQASPAHRLDVTGTGRFTGALHLSDVIDFTETTGSKILLYGSTYGIGVESNTLTAWSATRHRWRIGGTDETAGTERMALTAAELDVSVNLDLHGSGAFHGTISSAGANAWSNGLTGWGVTNAGAADFRVITADELIVKAFTADVAQALVGSFILSKSRGVLASNFTVPAAGATATLHVEDLEEMGPIAVFETGDTVRMRYISRAGGGLVVLDVWGTVSGYTDNGDGTQSWTFTRAAGETGPAATVNGGEIYKGAVVLDYGVSGDPLQISTVLGIGDGGYTQGVRWYDDAGDGVPDRYETDYRLGDLTGLTRDFSGTNVPLSDPGLFTEKLYVYRDANNYFRVDGTGFTLVQEGESFATIRATASANAASVSSQASILTANGLTNQTTITQRVDDIGAEIVLTADAGGNVSAISLESGEAGSAITLSASQIDVNGVVSLMNAGTTTKIDGSVVTTGTLQDASGTSVLDLDAGDLTLGDRLFYDRSLGTLRLGPANGNRILADGTAIEVLEGTTSVAEFGSTLRLGALADAHVDITSTAVTFTDTVGNVTASFGQNEAVVGRVADTFENVKITGSGIEFRSHLDVWGSMNNGLWTLGQTGHAHMVLSQSGIQMFDDQPTPVEQVYIDNTGLVRLGPLAAQHVTVDGSAMQFKESGSVLAEITGGTFKLAGGILTGTTSEVEIAEWNVSALGITSGNSNLPYDGVNPDHGYQISLWSAPSAVNAGATYNRSTRLRGLHIQWHESGNAGNLLVGDVMTAADGTPAAEFNEWTGIQASKWNDVANPFFQLAFDRTASGWVEDTNVHNVIAGHRFDRFAIWTSPTRPTDASDFASAGYALFSDGTFTSPFLRWTATEARLRGNFIVENPRAFSFTENWTEGSVNSDYWTETGTVTTSVVGGALRYDDGASSWGAGLVSTQSFERSTHPVVEFDVRPLSTSMRVMFGWTAVANATSYTQSQVAAYLRVGSAGKIWMQVYEGSTLSDTLGDVGEPGDVMRIRITALDAGAKIEVFVNGDYTTPVESHTTFGSTAGTIYPYMAIDDASVGLSEVLRVAVNPSGGEEAFMASPTVSIGQLTRGYDHDGGWMGRDAGVFKASWKASATNYLRFTGSGVEIATDTFDLSGGGTKLSSAGYLGLNGATSYAGATAGKAWVGVEGGVAKMNLGGKLTYDGSALSVEGHVEADTGKVGSWNFNQAYIYSGSSPTVGDNYAPAGEITLFANGSVSGIRATNFRIDTGTGNAHIRGEIIAQSGSIDGDLTLGGSLVYGAGGTGSDYTADVADAVYGAGFWSFNKARVDTAGKLWARQAELDSAIVRDASFESAVVTGVIEVDDFEIRTGDPSAGQPVEEYVAAAGQDFRTLAPYAYQNNGTTTDTDLHSRDVDCGTFNTSHTYEVVVGTSISYGDVVGSAYVQIRALWVDDAGNATQGAAWETTGQVSLNAGSRQTVLTITDTSAFQDPATLRLKIEVTLSVTSGTDSTASGEVTSTRLVRTPDASGVVNMIGNNGAAWTDSNGDQVAIYRTSALGPAIRIGSWLIYDDGGALTCENDAGTVHVLGTAS